MDIRNNNLTFGSKVMLSPNSFERISKESTKKFSAAFRKLEKNGVDDFVRLDYAGSSWDSRLNMTVTEKRGNNFYIGECSRSTLSPDCTIANLYKEAREKMRLAEVPKSLIKYTV